MTDEFVWMLSLDAIVGKGFFRKVFEVVGDDDASLAADRGSEDVPIIRVGQP